MSRGLQVWSPVYLSLTFSDSRMSMSGIIIKKNENKGNIYYRNILLFEKYPLWNLSHLWLENNVSGYLINLERICIWVTLCQTDIRVYFFHVKYEQKKLFPFHSTTFSFHWLANTIAVLNYFREKLSHNNINYPMRSFIESTKFPNFFAFVFIFLIIRH